MKLKINLSTKHKFFPPNLNHIPLEKVLFQTREKANRAIEGVGKLYEREKERKQSRQVKVVTVVSNNNNKSECTHLLRFQT